jgi:CheY-like chemotaxis protein
VSKIVLCVDDSATMQMVADITFRGTDFTYVGARSFDEAMQKAKAGKPVIVLADASMPGKNGYDLCQEIKAQMSDVPVVILIGNGAPYDAAKGTQVGADANLTKPWDTQTMLEKVTEIVSKGASAKPGQGAGAAAAPAAKPAAAPAPAAAAAAAAAANQPPRSATIMGMPTIKMPAGVAPTVTAAAPTPPAPAKTQAMAVPPVAASLAASAGLRPPAPAAQPAAAAAAPPASSASAPVISGVGGMNRAPMVAGNATKRSKLVEATLAKMAARLAEATGLTEGSPELAALLKLSAEVVERVVWEVVPDLAEQIIRENLDHLAAARRS